MTKQTKPGVVFFLTCLASTAMPARADLLTNWNLVTTSHLYASSNVEGAVRVGGDLYVQKTFEVAAKQGSPESSNPSLMVGGDVKTNGKNPETIKILKGNGLIGGAINGSTDGKGRIVSARDGGAVKVDSSISRIGDADAKELLADSQAFQAMKGGDQSIYLSTKQVDTARFQVLSVDSSGNAVFDVDGKTLFENKMVRGFSLDLNGYKFGDGQSIVFNVGGADLDFRSGLNFDGAFRNSVGNIIWNFYEAKEIDLNKNNFAGSLLAPNAVLTNSNSINGSVFVNAFGTRYGDGMLAGIRVPMYAGYDPSAVPIATTPEPSSLAMAGLALLCGAAWRSRRRKPA